MAQRHSSRSFALSFSLVSLLISSSSVAASAVSTSVFPNSACAGGKKGLVGVGKVTLSNGQVETHCGCPSDNLPSFEACPSSTSGEAVCNSILNLDSGMFSASCGIVACTGAACPSTVVNTVVFDDDDCFTNGKGALGITNVDGESKCACASEAIEFTECPRPAGGRATCVSTDSDFLGMAYSHEVGVKCGITCDEGFFMTAAGSCAKLTKRDLPAPHARRQSASPSYSYTATATQTITMGASQYHHHHGPSPSAKWKRQGPSVGPSVVYTATATATVTMGASQYHHMHGTPSAVYGASQGASQAAAGPSQRARRAADEFVFTPDVCGAQERSCPAGEFGEFSCVRLDDVTECGGCASTGDAQNCLEIPGIAAAVCLRGGCVVRSCQPGFVQTADGECSRKA